MRLIVTLIWIILFMPSSLFADSFWNELAYIPNGQYCEVHYRYLYYRSDICELEVSPEVVTAVYPLEHCNSSNRNWQCYDGNADYPEGESVGGCDGSLRYYDCSPVFKDANDLTNEFPDLEQWWYFTSTGRGGNTYNCILSYRNSSGDVIEVKTSDYHSIDPSISTECVSAETLAAMNSNDGSCDHPVNAFNSGVYTEFDKPDSTFICIDSNGDGSDDLTGTSCLSSAIPRADGELGDPGQNTEAGNSSDCPKGAPVWKVNMVNMNFYMTDIPLWYESPLGPPVSIQLSYNSQSTISEGVMFGRKWTLNYSSFLTIDPDGNITISMPDGKKDVFVADGNGGYIRPLGVSNKVEKIDEYHYRLIFISGAYYVYRIPAGSGLSVPYLTEIADAYGQKLVLGYNSSGRLEVITDALGRATHIIDIDNDGLVERVEDPFGRSASFEYDENDNLIMVMDMGGYSTWFTYDSEEYVASISNERGTWSVDIEPDDGVVSPINTYPEPGGAMGETYRITITDPLGSKEEYFYNGTYSWYISPVNYRSYETNESNNYTLSPKTVYVLTGSREERKISRIQYPGGGYLKYEYEALTEKPVAVTDYHGDGIEHVDKYSYNDLGLVTSFENAKNTVTRVDYYPNGIDVHTIVNGLGTTTYAYNDNHSVTSMTDRLDIETVLSYNSFGQLLEIAEAKGALTESITTFVYDNATHNLIQVLNNGNVLLANTYDDIGRVSSITDASGLVLEYEYNDLNQVTKIIYPDGRYEQFGYSACCPRMLESKKERSGLTTNYFYDAMKRLVSVQRAGVEVGFAYDGNGNIIEVADENGNLTSFAYDVSDRLIRKTFADNSSVTFDYDASGLLVDVINVRGISKRYAYDNNHNLTSVSYSDGTPAVAYEYDDYDRLISREDGIGRYQYSYDAHDRLINIDGPWGNDSIGFQYDELDRLISMTPQKGEAVSYLYDDLSRMTGIEAGPGIYTYDYYGLSSLVRTMARPGGSYSEYFYDDPLKRLTASIDKSASGEIIRGAAFIYDDNDHIQKEEIEASADIALFKQGTTAYSYDETNRLLSSVNPDRIFEYDKDGNMTASFNPDGYLMDMMYDAENRLKTLEYVDIENVVNAIEYCYSGDSLLAEIRKYEDGLLSGVTRFLREGFLVLQERDQNNTVTNEFTWGADIGGGIGGLLNLKRSGNNYSYIYDGKGNIAYVLDSSQNVVASYNYNVFGKSVSVSGDFDQPFRFSTKRYDDTTGLSYFGYRFYNPSLGKWMTRDPLGEAGGVNLYEFVGNNPVNTVDAAGLWGSDVHSGIGNSSYGTYKWAREIGFSDSSAKTIAVATNDADNNWNFLPLIGTPGRHFNTGGSKDSRDVIAKQNMQLAIHMYKNGHKQTAYKLLGIGLHAVQDKVAHGQWPFYKVHPAWFDNVQKRPDAIAVTEYYTKKYLQDLLRGTCN